jgi:hypothetical protein
MTAREIEEYRELRATIRERGTARVWIFVVGVALWASLAIGTSALAAPPVATLLPLLLLSAIFEAVFALHIGVERVGRYLQVFHEDTAEERRWEHTAMAYGRRFAGGGSDPLFCAYFWMTAAANMLPLLLVSPTRVEWVGIGVVHVLFAARVGAARRRAAGQRATDLERFERLKENLGVSADHADETSRTTGPARS